MSISSSSVSMPAVPSYSIRKVGLSYIPKAFSGFPSVGGSTSLSTVFNACANKLTNGGRIHIVGGLGTYAVDAPLVTTYDYTHISGDDRSTYLYLNASVNNDVIQLNSNKCSVSGLRINGNADNNGATSYGIDASSDGDSGHLIYNNRIDNCNDDAIHYGHASPWGSGNMGGRIYANEIEGENGNASGIFLDYTSTDIEVWGNLLKIFGTEGSLTINGSSARVFGNHFWGTGYYDVLLAPTNTVRRLTFSGNGFMDCGHHGIYWGSGLGAHDIVLTGNMFWKIGTSTANTYDSIYLGGSVDLRNWSITGNTFSGYTEEGAGTQYTRYAINDVNTHLKYSVIGFNTVYRYFQAAPINVADATNDIAHNVLYDNG